MDPVPRSRVGAATLALALALGAVSSAAAQPWTAARTLPYDMRPLGTIVVTAGDSRLVDAFTFRHGHGPLVYGGAYPLPEMGAVAHDLLIDSVAFLLVVPTSPSGLAAQWLHAGPPRSRGVQLGVADLGAVERALAARDIRGVRMGDRGLTTGLWLFPEVTGGPLLEFVQITP